MTSLKNYIIKKLHTEKSDSSEPSKASKQANKNIEDNLHKIKVEDNRTLKLLLLGAGGGGKSTIMKQMDRIYNKDLNAILSQPKFQKSILQMIHKNIIHDAIDLCKHFVILKSTVSGLQFESSELEELAIRIASDYTILTNGVLTFEFASDIEKLWNSPAFKQVFHIRMKSHIMDNTPFFFNDIMKYASEEYIPNFEDYVRVREQTTGVTTSTFPVQGFTREWIFNAIDVGGQRAERRKWLNVFQNINVVLYVMSLAAYDQVLFEDNTQRCWDETFSLFDQTINHKAFLKTDFIIFLNKCDIFEDKISKISFMNYINGEHASNLNALSPKGNRGHKSAHSGHKSGSYEEKNNRRSFFENDLKWEFSEEDEHSSKAVKDWTKDHFLNIFYASHGGKERYIERKIESERAIFFHVTCATDVKQIETVINIVKIQMLKRFMNRNLIL